jgi:GNAT superfamily N-acetyltransferase
MQHQEKETPSAILIAPFSSADQAAVQQFCVAIWSELGWPLEFMKGFDDLDTYFQEGVFFVAKDGEKIVGCGGITPLSREIGVLKRFYIAPDSRGSELSVRLLQQLLDSGKKLGCTQIVLDVHFKNERAMQFYQKHGFVPFTPEPSSDWSESQQPELYRYFSLQL